MLNPLKDVLTVEMVRSLIAKIKGALATKVSMGDVVSSWQSTPDDAHVPTEKLVKDTLDNLPPGTAVKGDAESEYRTGNVNLTPANIGAATASQGAKADAAVQGVKVNGTELTKDENNKVSIPDGTAAQKGVVQLNNAINSTSTTEAATPKAVKDAYDELNNKIVARAVFLSQAEWAVQSQIPGDPAKVYYVENGTGEDAYTVYVWKESTSEYVEVDESSIDLDGYWHDGPTTTGNGNVVTGISLGNDGVPQVEKGMSAEPAFSVLPVNKGGTGKTTGKAATNNLFSDINNVNTDPDDTARIVFKYGSPSDSNGIFFARAITNLWNYIKSKISSVLGLSEDGYTGNAATATSATTATNYASGGGIANAINAKQDTISDLATIRSGAAAGATALQPSGNGSNLSVTPDGTSTGYDLGSSTTLKAFAQKFKNLVGALKALAFKDSVGTSDIADDAITADKIKDNETLPVNISGNAATVNFHTVDKNVPSNAVFTDTTYSKISRGSGAGLAPGLPSGSGTSKYLREDGTWQTPPNDTYSAGDGLTLTEMNQFSVENPFNPNGDYSSNTLKAKTAVSADSAGNYSSGGGIDNALQGKAPKRHIDTQGIYGLANEGYYGHVKLEKGNISGRAYYDGGAASVEHNHDGSYLKTPHSNTLQWGGRHVIGTCSGNDIVLTMPENPFNPNGDYSSNTLKAKTAVYDSAGENIATEFTSVRQGISNLDTSVSDIYSKLKNTTRAYNYNANNLGLRGYRTIDTIYTTSNDGGSGINASHAPITGFCIYETILYNDDSNYGFQRATAWSSNRCWIRCKTAGTWSSWKEL